ncbi:MAG: NAD(P)/FAD-dependent oxidoreductase [Marmoricola sp.]
MTAAPETLSFWHATAGEDWTPRSPLEADATCDVAIVGAGLTGLWTAYYLIRADPSLRIVVLEAEVAGFGASGRNGGWCSALFPASLEKLADLPGSSRTAALAQDAAMRATVDEVGAVLTAEGIDADFHKGGTVVVARTAAQEARGRNAVAANAAWGLGEHLQWLEAAEASERLGATGVRGGTWTPDCACVHPAKLVRGLARVVEHAGVRIHEQTAVLAIYDRRVVTAAGSVSAEVVVRATEGYTAGLEGEERTLAPVYSLVVATEPLDSTAWDVIGLRDRETFSDLRHLIVYGLRTADDRLVFGGRGAPYHFGSRIRTAYDRVPRVHEHLRRTLLELFPVLGGVPIEHAWGGPLGIPRDWCASVGLDRSTGRAWAGGYVGDGVSTTNLAGRTLRDLILGHRSDLTALPWVNHRSPRWEPEPWRWLGANAGLRVVTVADAEERITGRPSALARAAAPLLGGH